MHRSLTRIAAAAVLLACIGAPAAARAAGTAYVSNQQGAVSVVDLDTLEVRSTLETAAKGPRGIGLAADGRWLVTANMADQNISVIDTGTGEVLRQVPIGKNPEFVRILGERAYVTFEPGSGGAPPAGGGAKGEDEERIPGHVAVVDLRAGKVVLDIVGKPETEGVEFTHDGKTMILTNESDNSLSLHDAATGRLLRTVSVAAYGERPRGIKAAPDGSHYVTTLELSGRMLVLDAQFDVVRQVATGKAPYGVAFDREGRRVFVAAAKDKVLQVFDVATWEKIKDIPTGDRCWHFSFTPEGDRILLACGKSNELVVIDTRRLEVVKRIGGLKAPWGVVTWPWAPGSID